MLLWYIAAVVLAIWLFSWGVFHIGGDLVHLLLFVVLVLVIIKLAPRRG